MDVKQLHIKAKELGVCSRFKGNESKEELIKIFTTVQGIEFCAKNNFPSMDQLREFKGDLAQSLGVFIDAGEIVLHNPKKVVLIGKTNATITCDDMAEFRHEIITMYGAVANIVVLNYAVVFAQRCLGGGAIEVTKQDNSIVYVR